MEVSKNLEVQVQRWVDDLKYVECFKCHIKEHYANKCPESKAKDVKAPLKSPKN